MRTQKPPVKLENWAVVPSTNPASYEVLKPGNLLVGRAFGHQRIKQGTFIFSSPIVHVDARGETAETRNTSYTLGEMSQDYKEWLERQASQTAA